MSDRKRPWRKRERKHWRQVDKRRQKGKVQGAPLPEINDGLEEPTAPAAAETGS